MVEVTKVLLDNTSLAAAGRAIYHGDKSTEGGKHAESYYERYSDAVGGDQRSLAEVLTAIVLFDEVLWEASSWYTQELPEMQALHGKLPNFEEAWVYSWFPIFLTGYKRGALRHHLTDSAGLQLSASHMRAVQWVSSRFQDLERPLVFKVPLCYQDIKHPEWDNITNASKAANITLLDEQIPIALFLSRGLYYQAVALKENGWCYLPHSYRNFLLNDASAQAAALICSWTTTVDAQKVLEKLDKTFLQRVTQVSNTPEPIYTGISLGAAFLRHSKTPLDAIEEALQFRCTSEGEEIRQYFRALLQLGYQGNIPQIKAHIADIDKALCDAALHKFGYLDDYKSDDEKLLFGFFGPLKSAFEAAFTDLFGRSTHDAITRFLHTPISRPSGFQVLFSYYFPRGLQYDVHNAPRSA